MSVIHEALGAPGSPAGDQAEVQAVKKARWAAAPGDWLTLALDQHSAIRAGFAACRAAPGGRTRLTESRRLARLLNGHCIAEELVLYPALAQSGGRPAAAQAYGEHTLVKLQLAELERMDPSTDAWLEKLELIHQAVRRHMHEEEKGWFLELKDRAPEQTYLTKRFQEEFARYAGEDAPAAGAGELRSFAPTQVTTGDLDRH